MYSTLSFFLLLFFSWGHFFLEEENETVFDMSVKKTKKNKKNKWCRMCSFEVEKQQEKML